MYLNMTSRLQKHNNRLTTHLILLASKNTTKPYNAIIVAMAWGQHKVRIIQIPLSRL